MCNKNKNKADDYNCQLIGRRIKLTIETIRSMTDNKLLTSN